MFRFTFFFACFLSMPAVLSAQELTNEKIWYSSEFRMESVSGIRSMNDGEHYTTLESNPENGTEIVQYSYVTGERTALIASSKSVFNDATKSIDDYQFSADEQRLLISTQTSSIYRHSTEAQHYIYDLTKQRSFPLADIGKGKQRLAMFSPDGNHVAFVRANNVYIVNLLSREETQVTKDGKVNEIINGATDWVYEEEFGFDNGMYWSPQGNRLAYYRFDESKVREFQMAMYGTLYPEQHTFKYPKAGERNSTVNIFVYDLEKERSTQVDTGTETDLYIPRIKWTTDNNRLCVMRLNRHQNHLELLLADLTKAEPFSIPVSVMYEEKADSYIEINDNLIFLDNNGGFLWNSERDGFNHIYHFDLSGNLIRQVTSGAWDVIDFIGYEPKSGLIYYTSAQEGPLEQHLYVVSVRKGKPARLSTRKGNNRAVFSSNYKYYINYHSDANSPYYITLHNAKGREMRVIKTNDQLKQTLDTYQLSAKTFFTFKNEEGTELNGFMIKPNDFDPTKKYPVFVNIYGGPGSNRVKNAWDGPTFLFHQLLAKQGYIVVSCDPRGTMYRGRAFKHSTYMQLGKLETEDFIDLAKYLQTLDYVDDDRIGIMGWSYGGYMSSLCMTKGADHYRMGIAIAPVTNWRFYDTIYTERFMRTPQENPEGYDENSPINHVDKLKGKYLLIHGSADDNVHYQNTMEMVNALVNANKPFDLFIYPDRNHGIYGGKTRLHLFNKINAFIVDHL